MVSYTYCGSGLPTSFYSLKNEVVVSFTSDGSVSKSGFQIDYRTIGKYVYKIYLVIIYTYIYTVNSQINYRDLSYIYFKLLHTHDVIFY